MTSRPQKIETYEQLSKYLDSDFGRDRHNGYNYADFLFFIRKLNDTAIGKLFNRDGRTIKSWRKLAIMKAENEKVTVQQ